jgi:hypothetical protein
MEHQLDETMAKMRRNLMVIRLLGLLSEDNGLQDSLMAESDRLVIRLLGLLSEDTGLQDSLMAESDRLSPPTELAVLLE